MKRRSSSGVRYRPYRRSVSIHRSSPEVVYCGDDDDDLDDTIVVLYDGVRQRAAAAATAATAATSKAVGDIGKATAVASGAADTFQKADTAVADGVTSKSQLDYTPWRVSRIPLPVDPNTPDLSRTLCASPTTAGASAKPANGLTVEEVFSPFTASPLVVASGAGTVKKQPRTKRTKRKGPVTSTPAVAALGGKRAKLGPATSTPTVQRPNVSEVEDITPFVITLDEDPSMLEVTEVRRVVRRDTPSVLSRRKSSTSADFLPLDTSAEMNQPRTSKRTPSRTSKKTPSRTSKKTPSRISKKSPACSAKTPASSGEKPTAGVAAAGPVNLESSLEEGELSRTHHSRMSDAADRTVVRVRPLRRTSSTQRRLKAVLRNARRTLNQSRTKTRSPSRSSRSGKSSRSSKSSRHHSRRHMKRPKEPQHWTVDRRGSRFAAPLGGTSDQPIQFTPDFSESFARMVEERPKRPIIIDGPNVAYAHGRNQVCSIRGVKIALDYFKNLGHKCTVFMPSTFVNRARNEENVKLLEEIYRDGDLAYTPSRYIRGRLVTSYDDRYVVMYATRVGGVIVSRDLYRDVASERPDWKDTIDNRLLIPVFVGDQLLLPPDPLGRDGPGLLEFLTFPPGTSLLPG